MPGPSDAARSILARYGLSAPVVNVRSRVSGTDNRVGAVGVSNDSDRQTHGAEAAISRFVRSPVAEPWHDTLGRQELSQRWTPTLPLGHLLDVSYTRMLDTLTMARET